MDTDKYILRGPEPQFKFPEEMTMANLMYDQLLTHGDNVAQIQKETNVEITFSQIFEKSRRLAVYLKNHHVQVNDRIAICSENNIGWAVPMCATIFVGATICPLNPMYSDREFLHALNISKPKFIFVSPVTVDTIQKLVKGIDWSPILIIILNHPRRDVSNVERITSEITDKSMENFEFVRVDRSKHVLSLLCSSGTTGLPKGVMLTDKNYLTIVQNVLESSIANQGQVLICLLPFFHAYCFTVSLLGLIAGSKAIVFSQFKEDAFLDTIQKYKIETLTMVPPLMVFLAKHPIVDKYDLSSVKLIWCGAAPLSREIEQAVKKRLNNPEIRQGYGMTETTLSVLKIPENCPKYGSVGTLLPGVLAKVIEIDDGDTNKPNKTLGPYSRGELCFKGDLIMKGYAGDTKATSDTIDEDGWLHTGDIGYYDEDGYFYIVDRLKELIKYKGFQVPPAELEAILLTNPNIKDAAVVGLPNEEAGELPIAFVVKQPGARITADEVINFVNERVSNQKRLRGGVRFLDEIPKNPSGKILRRELRSMLKSKI